MKECCECVVGMNCCYFIVMVCVLCFQEFECSEFIVKFFYDDVVRSKV